MIINVSWPTAHNSEGLINYKIYRSTASGSVYSSAPIFTTTDISKTSYDDQDIPDSATGLYYYGTEVVTTTGTLRSKPIMIVPTLNPGVGGVEITMGDNRFGYVGEAPLALYQLASLAFRSFLKEVGIADITATSPYMVSGGKVTLSKYVYSGGFLYVPSVYAEYTQTPMACQVYYDSFLKPLIDNPLYFKYLGSQYKLVLLSKEQAFDMHLGSSLAANPRSSRFVKKQTVGTLNGQVTAFWFAPSESGDVNYTATYMETPVITNLASATNRRGAIAWGLIPVGDI